MKETKKNGAKKSIDVEGPMHQADRAAMESAELSLEQVRSYLVRDIKGIYVLLADILNSDEVTDALAQAIYQRYEKHMQAKKAAPELPLNEQ